jgi:hypothetical protein
MKKLILGACALTCAASVFAQGTVIFNNRLAGTIITHVYGADPANTSLYVSGYGANDFNGTGPGTTTWGGALLAGSGFSAQLWAAPTTGTTIAPESSLQAATPITSFRTGTGAGWVAAATATLTGVAADAAVATIALRVWDNQGGTITSWDQAVTASAAHGESPLFNLNAIGGQANPAPALVGLQSFNITGGSPVIPEPSTFALAGLGAAALLIFRRRK